jgi:biopolymer transport protein ExbB
MDATSKPKPRRSRTAAPPETRARTPRRRIAVLATAAVLAVTLTAGLWAQIATGPAAASPPQTVRPPARTAATPLVEEVTIPTRNLLQVMRDGGPVMIPIGVCSVLLLVFVFERFISLRRGRVIPRPFVKRFLEQIEEGQLDRDAALELCAQNRSPAAAIFAAAVRKWGRPSVEVEQAIMDAGERVTNDLRKYLRLLNGLSAVSPLLGLLGTVFGMIAAFNEIAMADAMGRAEQLAGGIGQALLTTAAGLCVAIPALIAYLYFAGRVDQLIVELDRLGQKLVDMIAGDAPGVIEAERPAPGRRREKAA